MFRKFWSMLLVLVASSLMVTVTVHAREIPGNVSIDCSGSLHVDGDADESKGDADAAIPHHHGTCHASSLGLVSMSDLLSARRLASLRPISAPESAMPSHRPDPALRPPDA